MSRLHSGRWFLQSQIQNLYTQVWSYFNQLYVPISKGKPLIESLEEPDTRNVTHKATERILHMASS